MATVSQSLKLNDGFTPVINNMSQSMQKALGVFEQMERAIQQNMDISSFYELQQQLHEAGIAMRMAQEEQERLNATMRRMEAPDINTPKLPEMAMPRAPTMPVPNIPQMNIPQLGVQHLRVDMEGHQEALNKVMRINSSMETLITTQDKISRQAQAMDFIPINTTDKIQKADKQIQALTQSLALTQRKQQALNTTMSKAESDRAVKSINILENDILRALQVQEKLNRAMESGDLSQINSSVEKLTRNIASAENQVAKLNKQYSNIGIDTLNPMINQPGPITVPPVTVPPITIPEVTIPRLDMPPIEMDVQGYEEARNNVLRINTNLERLVTTQNNINRQAQVMDFIPGSTQTKIQKADTSLQGLTRSLQIAQTRQQQLNTTMSKTEASKAVKSIDVLESKILKAVRSQEKLNRAMETGDLKAVNRAANELTRNIARADRETQKMNRSQQSYNASLDAGNNRARGLLSTLRNIAGVYAGLSAAKNMFSGALDQKHAEITFQARFGDAEVGTAMFNKLQKQAETSAFAFEELAQNTLSFMSMTTNPKQLDGLNSLAEKLAMFDTTGQGLAGAGFSIKEAMSGDIVSLAERFNINKSAIRAFGLDELGKAGDIEGFVKQFDAMLEAMNMGDEAVAMLADSPKQRLNTFVSNFKTAFSSAATASIEALQPLMDRLNAFMSSDGFQVFLNNISIGLTNLANGAIWAWDGLTQLWGVLTNVYAAIEPYSGLIWGVIAAFAAFQVIAAVGSVAMGIYGLATGISAASQLMHAGASFAAAAGQTSLNAALLACPITWIVIAIVGLIAVLIYLWKTNDQVAAWFMRAWNNVLNFAEAMGIGFMAVFYGILDFMGYFRTGFLSILEGAINGAIGMINGFIELLNMIPGVSIDVVGQVSFAAGAQAEEEAKRQSRADDINERMASYNEKVAAREQKVQDMLVDRELKRQEKADKKANRASKSTEALDNHAGKQMDLGNIDNIDKVGSVGGIDDPVEVEDTEFIKLMQELAQVQAVQNFVTLKPEVTVTTGDIHKDVDIDDVVKRIEESIEVEVAAHAKVVYNLG